MKNRNNNNKERRHCGCYKEPCASQGTGILTAIAIKYPEWLNRKTNHVLAKLRLFEIAWLKLFYLKAPITLFHNVSFYCTTRKETLNELLLIYTNVLNSSIIVIRCGFMLLIIHALIALSTITKNRFCHLRPPAWLLQGFVWETCFSDMKIVHKMRSERF